MKSLKNSRQHFSYALVAIAFVAAMLIIPGVYTASAFGKHPPAVKMVPQSFTQLAKTASPAVVNVSTVKLLKGVHGRVFKRFFKGPRDQQDPFDQFFEKFFQNQPQRELKQKSLGSGFILAKDGYIVTNAHVIENADKIQVKLKDGKEYPAEIIGSDASTDLALIKIKPEHKLTVLKLGNSDKLEVGQWVVAIGNPFGLEHTVTAGIVSAKGRVIGAGPYDDFIQTDASINPGNSGGPLINMEGEVVGINTAIMAGGDGIGFAIPANMAKNVIDQLKDKGEVSRGWLGVSIQDLDSELQEYYDVDQGVLVVDVVPGDPAEKAGIQAKDIIISVNNQAMESARELSKFISTLSAGDKAKIKISRNGKIKTFKVKIAQRDDSKVLGSDESGATHSTDELGIYVSNITPEIAHQLKLADRNGVIVDNVEPDSKGDKADIAQGDIIREINHHPVKNVSDYKDLISDIKDGDTIQLYIKSPYKGFVVKKLTK
ncbi:MAG: DegQ family serine endoprotease [Dissulfuribacterales bacterium]